jgi:hypothetical protein
MSPRNALLSCTVSRLVILGVILSGCSQTTPGDAHSEPAAPQFPDLSSYSAVKAEQFYLPLRGGPSYEFITPNQIHCRTTLGGIACSGNLPAVPDSAPEEKGDGCALVEGDLSTSGHTGPYSFSRGNGQCPPFGGDHFETLAAGQKTTLYMFQTSTVTCGVGPNDLLACTDTDSHGFVVQPSGSWTF